MMASATTQAKKAPAGDDLVPLAIDSLDEIAGEEPPIVLSLDDLVSDQNDEVVLFNDSGLRTLAVSTSAMVVAEGESGRHVTAAGEDVSGFRYIAFDSGLKLFFQPGLDLILVREPAAAG